MSLPDNPYELIDRYLNGEMSIGEKADFEERLKSDKEFAEQFEIQNISYQIVVGQNLLDLKARMQKDLSGSKYDGNKNNSWKYFGGGAGLILIAALLYFFLKSDGQVKPEVKSSPVPVDTVTSVTENNEVDTAAWNNIPEFIPENSKDQNAVINKDNDLCKDTLISFSCQARAACADQSNGAIEVDLNTIKYGKAPFEFSIHPNGEFISEPFIGDLKQGKYSLFVRDAKGCIRRLNVKVEVPSIDCK
ncbi:MAG: hypothetical protein J7604_07835 [Sporocytophaga sp.]|uniref:hypothetical protein n=1 Tax=Sporocytophaga sp. TaxID=2231183 RepID=UPI001B26D015|nr:hypothetical protein [Sporocytophaga sp.]MBO9700107.1 hypothetical protein [Sporocytophaga sp.]